MSNKPSMQAWILLIILALIWGSSFILIKKGLVYLTPVEVGSIRMLSASIALLPFVRSHLKLIKKEKIKYFIAVGLSGSFIPAFLFAIAQTRLESAVTGILNALTPLFTVLLGWWIFKQRQGTSVWLGIFIGFIGSFFLITAGSQGKLSQINYYSFFVILATTLYATNSNLIKFRLNEYKALTITSISLLFVGPISAIVLLFSDFPQKIGDTGTLEATFYVCLLGVLGTAVALIIFNKIVQLTNPVFTSSVTYIIPLVALIWGLWDGETLILSHILGMIAILIGVYVTNQTVLIRKGKKL